MFDPTLHIIGQWFFVAGYWVSRAGDVMLVVSLVAALTFARPDLARRWRVAAVAAIGSMVVLQVLAGVLAVVSVAFNLAAVQVPASVAYMFGIFAIGSSLVLVPVPPEPQGFVPIYVYLPVLLVICAVAWQFGRLRRQRGLQPTPTPTDAPVDA